MQKIITLLCFLPMLAMAQQTPKNPLTELLNSRQDLFGLLLKNPDLYEIQILYTQIDRDKNNKPKFTSYSYGLDANHYFYPASTVKFPASILALEKINNLKIKGLSKSTTMLTDANYEEHTPVLTDSTAQNGLPSVEHYIKKILMVSDNDAFNRLYEFLGQQYINEKLYEKGYKNLRLVHRLQTGMDNEQQRRTNPIRFVEADKVVYQQGLVTNDKKIEPIAPILRGKGYMSDDKLIEKPLDFTNKNYFAIADQQAILKAVLFPESVPAAKRFNLTPSDYRFLYQYMSQLPTESLFPKYDAKEFYPTYCKFLMFGSQKEDVWPKGLRIFNKVGDAYGFLLDNAYVADFDKGVEFMLTAVMYCNADQIYNDDKYDYDSVGYPFYKNLGQVLYQYELARPKKYKPDLSKFVMKYDK